MAASGAGPIPVEALSKLTNLTELDISDNRFEEPGMMYYIVVKL